MQLKHRFVLPLALVLSAVMLYPVAFSLWISLHDYRLTRLNDVRWVGFDNYTFIATDPGFLNAMGNTITFVIGAVNFAGSHVYNANCRWPDVSLPVEL